MIRVPQMLAYTKDFIEKTKMADDAEEELQRSLSNFVSFLRVLRLRAEYPVTYFYMIVFQN